MFKNSINYVIATVFEIKKGNDVIGHYPNDFDTSFESVMNEKFIPDGIHKFEEDAFCYKHLVPFNGT